MAWWLLDNTVIAAFLALIVALVCRVRRVPPVVRHALWLVVLIKLIAPPLFPGPIKLSLQWRSLAERLSSPSVIRTDPGSGILPIRDRTATRPQRIQSRATGQALEPSRHQTTPADETGAAVLIDARDATRCRVDDDGAFQSLDEQAESPAQPEVGRAGAGDRYSIDAPPRANLHANAEPFNSDPDDHIPAVDAPQIIDATHNAAQPSPPPETLSATGVRPMSAATFVTAGFLAATCVVIGVQVVRLVKLWRLLKRARPAPNDFLTVVEELAAMIGVRAPQVRLSADISSPLVCAFGRPVLVWPASRLASLRDTALRAVILHELAHLARRDHLVGWLELVAGCLWWWNPLFWYVRHQLRETAELACDAWVMALIPEGRRDYARALVDLAELDSRRYGAAPVLGVAEGSKNLFERRLVMIMGTRVRHRMGIYGILGTGLLALAALPGCTAGQAGEEPLVATEALSGTAAFEPAQLEPIESNSEAIDVDAEGPIAAEEVPLDAAELPPPLGLENPLNVDLADPAFEPPVVAPTNASIPGSTLEPDIDFADEVEKGRKHSSKTLILGIVSGVYSSVVLGRESLLEGPLDKAKVRRFAQRLRQLNAVDEEPYGRLVLRVDRKHVDPTELNLIIDACKANLQIPGSHVLTCGWGDTDVLARFDALFDKNRVAENTPSRKSAPAPLYAKNPISSKVLPSKSTTVGSKPAKPMPASPEYSLRPGAKNTPEEAEVETVALTRATYKFPADKVRALKAFTEFLATHLSDEVEVRFKDSALQVTASAEDQAVIAQFIKLLQARSAAAPKPSPPPRIEDDGAAPEESVRTKSGSRVGF
jgi:beta-lactamase regulating signal transducer with metallopeptidase domain